MVAPRLDQLRDTRFEHRKDDLDRAASQRRFVAGMRPDAIEIGGGADIVLVEHEQCGARRVACSGMLLQDGRVIGGCTEEVGVDQADAGILQIAGQCRSRADRRFPCGVAGTDIGDNRCLRFHHPGQEVAEEQRRFALAGAGGLMHGGHKLGEQPVPWIKRCQNEPADTTLLQLAGQVSCHHGLAGVAAPGQHPEGCQPGERRHRQGPRRPLRRNRCRPLRPQHRRHEFWLRIGAEDFVERQRPHIHYRRARLLPPGFIGHWSFPSLPTAVSRKSRRTRRRLPAGLAIRRGASGAWRAAGA